MAEKGNRPLQLTIYGATGFTGRLAALYVTKQYGGSVRWAVAGRSKSKLEAIRKECQGLPEIVIADSTDAASLKKMVEQTDVVVTAAGPFARYGTGLVAACAAANTDYCDLTGEPHWMRDMVAEYDDVARGTGARIVHLCGHDSIPWDISTMMLAKKLKQNNPDEQMASVDFWDKVRGGISGGTLQTAYDIIAKKWLRSDASKALGYDPLLKLSDGSKSSSNSKKNNVFFRLGSNASEAQRVFFFMSEVNGDTVKRSNALNHYGDNLVYAEGCTHKTMFKSLVFLTTLVTFGLLLFIPPCRWLLYKYVLPKAGEGPSEEEMAKGYLTVHGVARGTKGGIAKSTMKFSVDAGYKDSARMLVESGLTLCLDSAKLPSKGGVLTPASCMGETLLNRLIATGTTFTYDE